VRLPRQVGGRLRSNGLESANAQATAAAARPANKFGVWACARAAGEGPGPGRLAPDQARRWGPLLCRRHRHRAGDGKARVLGYSGDRLNTSGGDGASRQEQKKSAGAHTRPFALDLRAPAWEGRPRQRVMLAGPITHKCGLEFETPPPARTKGAGAPHWPAARLGQKASRAAPVGERLARRRQFVYSPSAPAARPPVRWPPAAARCNQNGRHRHRLPASLQRSVAAARDEPAAVNFCRRKCPHCCCCPC
jgi:hypothetical protein